MEIRQLLWEAFMQTTCLRIRPDPAHSSCLDADLMAETTASAELGVKPQTLRKWAVQGRGPARVKLGRRVFYRVDTLRAWIRAQEKDPSCREAA